MVHPANTYPVLTKSYKGWYPFKIGTTSFIYRDFYVPNVKLLGPYLDEIELLIFESDQVEALFSRTVVDKLLHLSRELKLSFNVHLPTDISISDHEPARQQHAADTLLEIIDRISVLSPSTFSMHIPYNEDSFDRDQINRWQDRVYGILTKMLQGGLAGSLISVEMLNYPFEIVEEIVIDLNLSICMDLGHLMMYGYDIVEIFNRYSSQISIIHLHGVDNNHDHLSLDRLPKRFVRPAFAILQRFTGSVSLEIFSFQDLKSSLAYLEKCWVDIQKET